MLPADLPRVLDLLDGMKGKIFLEGVFQNYASSGRSRRRANRGADPHLRRNLRAVRARGHRPSMIHIDNSAATFSRSPVNSPSKKFLFEPTHVRPGLALYARVPGLFSEANDSLSDVMSFVSVVDQVKTVPPGTRVGYGGTFVAGRTTTLAIVPAGFADGVPRHLSGRGQVLIGGRRCPIAGRVSMDLTAVDVTDLDARPARGEEVVFFGRQGTCGSASTRSRRPRERSPGRSSAASGRACHVSSGPEAGSWHGRRSSCERCTRVPGARSSERPARGSGASSSCSE